MKRSTTLWSARSAPDAQMMRYTIGDDREVDAHLLRWDVIGSLGHIEALRGGGIISVAEHRKLRRALLAALKAVDAGDLIIGRRHEDGHSAVEFWLTEQFGDIGERVHTGRSRNDQVAADLRLFLKDQVLQLHTGMVAVADVLLDFARQHRRVVWPGYTHQRAAMPSSAALWSAGFAEGILNAADSVIGFWSTLDRSPLGSAAGYGVPLPLARERAARALGFGGMDEVVTATQGTRGQLESQVLFWCSLVAHQLAKLSTDVALHSADEFGWLRLANQWSTGSSIMPQKRNPDLFELTRARAAALDGELATVMSLKAKLPSGYHRDYQLLKSPVIRALTMTRDMLEIMTLAVPALEVDESAAAKAMHGELFATDEVMRLVREGAPFRRAYGDVAARLKQGETMPKLRPAEIGAARNYTGSIGNVPIGVLQRRAQAASRWNRLERQRFAKAIARLTGTR